MRRHLNTAISLAFAAFLGSMVGCINMTPGQVDMIERFFGRSEWPKGAAILVNAETGDRIVTFDKKLIFEWGTETRHGTVKTRAIDYEELPTGELLLQLESLETLSAMGELKFFKEGDGIRVVNRRYRTERVFVSCAGPN